MKEPHIFDLLKKFNVTHVNVGYAKYKIIISNEVPENGVWGYCNPGTLTIYLLESMDNQQAREVLLHEATHALYEAIGYTSDSVDKVFKDTNEDLVLKTSRAFLMLINLNPKLMGLLISSKASDMD